MKLNVLDYSKECSCGKKHRILVRDILIEENALLKLPTLVGSYGYIKEHITVICDTNTYDVAGKKVIEMMQDCKLIILPANNGDGTPLHADNHGVELVKNVIGKSELLIAVGSGTIHDITRYIASHFHIDFISVPTAASVDGYVSTVCAMTWNGFKKTLPGTSPIAVVADTNIFIDAPYRLTASGISDLFAKYIALADWRISNVLTDEYICDYVCSLEESALELMMQHIDKLSSCDKNEKIIAYEGLMYALILSGLAMQMVGNSRPASGAEHHISHLLEMEVINDTLPFYHGEKVSVGLLMALEDYHKSVIILESNPILKNSNIRLQKELIDEYFGKVGLSNSVIDENKPNPLDSVSLERLTTHKENIIKIIRGLPSSNDMVRILSKAKCITSLEELGLSEKDKELIIGLSPYVRNRLTWMRVLKLYKNS